MPKMKTKSGAKKRFKITGSGKVMSAHEPHSGGEAGSGEGGAAGLSRPQPQEAHVPRRVDPAAQRGGASVRPQLQPVHRRAEQGWRDGRPKSPVRSGY